MHFLLPSSSLDDCVIDHHGHCRTSETQFFRPFLSGKVRCTNLFQLQHDIILCVSARQQEVPTSYPSSVAFFAEVLLTFCLILLLSGWSGLNSQFLFGLVCADLLFSFQTMSSNGPDNNHHISGKRHEDTAVIKKGCNDGMWSVTDSWVDLSGQCSQSGNTSPNRITPVPFGGDQDYIRMLREAQRESNRSSTKVSPISSAIMSLSSTTRNTPNAS